MPGVNNGTFEGRSGGQDADPKQYERAMADGCTVHEPNPGDRVGPRPWDDTTRDQDLVVWNPELMIHEYGDDRAANFCLNYNEGIRGTGVLMVPSDTPFNSDHQDV
jgi:hypothetical protein